MLNVLWPVIIGVSFIFGILNGNTQKINESIFNSTKEAVELCINLLRNNLFMEWNNENCFRDEHNCKNKKTNKTNYEISISRHKRKRKST